MSGELENNDAQASILPATEPPLVERAAAAAVLENLRREGEVALETTVEMTRKPSQFSWDINPQEAAKAISGAVSLPWVIWSAGLAIVCSMWRFPSDSISKIDRDAPSARG